jgi:imidazolonepropionase
MTAHAMGFKVKLHADEIKPIGGTALGIELGASSIDHLMNISDADIVKLAKTDVTANLLPGTSFYLKKKFAPARKLLDAGCIVSISGDYNPGSCPTENFQFIMQLASQHYDMKPEEILNATTLNAAYHLGIHESHGSLEPGKYANIVLLNVPNLSYMLYHFGINHTKDVFIEGKMVVSNRQIVRKT